MADDATLTLADRLAAIQAAIAEIRQDIEKHRAADDRRFEALEAAAEEADTRLRSIATSLARVTADLLRQQRGAGKPVAKPAAEPEKPAEPEPAEAPVVEPEKVKAPEEPEGPPKRKRKYKGDYPLDARIYR